MKMKEARSIEDLPKELLDALVTHYELEDGEMFDDCEEIYYYVLNDMGYGDNPKKKGEWYIGKSEPMKVGEFTIVAQYKQYIKDYDCICDEEFDCLLWNGK
jgi:hypothetical protein